MEDVQHASCVETVEAGSDRFEPWVEAHFAHWNAAFEDGHSADVPDPGLLAAEERLAGLRHPSSSARVFVLTRHDRGEVVGAARVEMPVRDNTTLVEARIAVPPAHRRRGHGSALLAAVRDLAIQEGRRTLSVSSQRRPEVPVEDAPGSAFLARRGFTVRLQDTRRDLQLPVPAHTLARLHQEAAAHGAGYRVEVLRGPVPVERRGAMAALAARMSTDAPLGELEYEPEVWDASRVAEEEEELCAMGISWWTAVAVHEDDDEWVAFTQLGWSPRKPERLQQWDTLVLREHRGARLGLAVKLAALEHATADVAQARTVTTWNATSNAPMVAVNEALGFRPVAISEDWQADVDRITC